MPEIKVLPGYIGEIFAVTSDTRCLSLADRYALMVAMLDESLDEEEKQAINRLLHFVVRGRIKLLG
jgi:hypothetical protein